MSLCHSGLVGNITRPKQAAVGCQFGWCKIAMQVCGLGWASSLNSPESGLNKAGANTPL